jgi:hypothetical protein
MPPFPDNVVVTDDLISPTTFADKVRFNMSRVPAKKLAPNLLPKERYVAHVDALKFYLEIGGCIGQIHRVLEFDQRPWLKTYIDYNTQRRQASTTKFERNYFKLMNNR